MADTHDVGPLFWHVVGITRGTPFAHRASSIEIQHPFRVARPLVLHIWPGKGLVLGVWRRTGWTEEEALRAATQAVDVDPLDLDGHLEPRYYRVSQ